jgi:hypothetical protein
MLLLSGLAVLFVLHHVLSLMVALLMKLSGKCYSVEFRQCLLTPLPFGCGLAGEHCRRRAYTLSGLRYPTVTVENVAYKVSDCIFRLAAFFFSLYTV